MDAANHTSPTSERGRTRADTDASPHPQGDNHPTHACTAADLSFLALLTSAQKPAGLVQPPRKHKVLDRRPQLDPLILETAAASGPEITRNHYLHEFFPHSTPYYSCDLDGDECRPMKAPPPPYTSQQGPRSLRLAREAPSPPPGIADPHKAPTNGSEEKNRNVPTIDHSHVQLLKDSALPALNASTLPQEKTTTVTCMARTRIPTPHGPVFLHLYHNTVDNKEHLAFVVDRQQSEGRGDRGAWLRSRSLDAEWREGESGMERIVRGAYEGRLGSGEGEAVASEPLPKGEGKGEIEPPLVRIHSECFTGETLGSQRCDCGEQLDAALQLLSTTAPYRGMVVYMRQEGRGIGLLEKIRAYNLQDLGHDTVTANLLLGHGADQRSYEVAAGILKDFGVDNGVRLLTNNPDKIEALEREAVRVVERVGMVPRQWSLGSESRRARRGRRHQKEPTESGGSEEEEEDEEDALMRHAGVGMIGGGITRSAELDKYLKTKVQRMRHMIDIPPTAPPSQPITQNPTRASSPMFAVAPPSDHKPNGRPKRARTVTQEEFWQDEDEDGSGSGLGGSVDSLRGSSGGVQSGSSAEEEGCEEGCTECLSETRP